MGKKVKVVIDTNVIISAFGWGGKPEEVFLLAEQGKIHNFITMDILTELARVVSYPQLGLPRPLQRRIIETVFAVSSIVHVREPLRVIDADPDDDRVLECAAAARAAYVISGDKHLLHLKRFGEIDILSPHDFLVLWHKKI